jgi:hypothetical protein
MAISSVGGADTTETPGVVSPEGVQQGAVSGSASTVTDEGAGKPFAVVDGHAFATQADLTTWWDARQSQQGADSVTGTDTGADKDTAAATGEDSLKGGQGEDAIPTDDEIRANLKKAGGIFADPKYEPFALEFEKGGGKMLSDESLAKAATEFGVPVDAVRAFIDGQIAQRTLTAGAAGQPTAAQVATATAIVEVIPDEKDYRSLLEWGKEGLTAAQRASYDAALDRGDTEVVKSLLGTFQAAMNAAGAGKGPRDVTQEGAGAGTGNAAGVQPYANSAQMEADMNKPEYASDPAFRAQVQARLGVSQF